MNIQDAVRIYMARRRQREMAEAFYGHKGRPGHRGGSAPGPRTQMSTGLLDRIDHDGGFTVSSVGLSPKSGYALSISPDNERILDMKTLTTGKMNRILRQYEPILKKEPRAHVGGWRDPVSGKVFFDVSIVTKNKSEAMALAKKHNQLAIYDLKHGKTINTGVKRQLEQKESKKKKLVRFEFGRHASAESIVNALKKDAEND